MSITVNIYYSGENGAARRFAQEMLASGTVEQCRQEKGNLNAGPGIRGRSREREKQCF